MNCCCLHLSGAYGASESILPSNEGQIDRVFRFVRPLHLHRAGVDSEALDDMQLIAVAHRGVQHAWQEPDGIDDQRVAVPAPD